MVKRSTTKMPFDVVIFGFLGAIEVAN